MENLISVKEANLIFRVYPKVRYRFYKLYEGFYHESIEQNDSDSSNKDFRLISPLPLNEDDKLNLSFEFYGDYRFSVKESKIILEDGTDYNFGQNNQQDLNFFATYYFDSEIILFKDLGAVEKNIIMGYYRSYIPDYNQDVFDNIDCFIRTSGGLLIPVSPRFAVVNPNGKLQTIKDGVVIEVTKDEEIPLNEKYIYHCFCC